MTQVIAELDNDWQLSEEEIRREIRSMGTRPDTWSVPVVQCAATPWEGGRLIKSQMLGTVPIGTTINRGALAASA